MEDDKAKSAAAKDSGILADKVEGEASVIDNEKDAVRQAVGEAYAKIGISAMPSCPGPEGILFDFCWGLRIYIPDSPQRKYRVQFWDVEDEKLCYDGVIGKCSWIQAIKHYYRPYFLRISDGETNAVIFEHRMDLKGKVVLMYFPVDTIGDTLAWFKSVEVFQRMHGCLVYVAVAPHMRRILEPAYPEMRFIDREQARTIHPYASYMFGVSYDDDFSAKQMDFRTVPLTWRGADILGLDAHGFQDEPPRVAFDRESPSEIEGPYVAISSMASGGCKLWLNPHGWHKVIRFLKYYGYRVIDIDGRQGTGAGFSYQFIPRDAEDFTGTGKGKELADRARQIHHADFFIGLGSGLSWLAWCVGKPVVLISGFSQPWCEFYTPYRVINPKVCHGCFNDVRYTFDQHDCYWCPRHKGTPRQLECSTQITPEQVINAIRRIPAFQERKAKVDAQKAASSPAPAVQQPPEAPAPVPAPTPNAQVWRVVNGQIVGSGSEAEQSAEQSQPNAIRPGQAGAAMMIESLQRRIDEAASERAAKPKDTLGNSKGKKGKVRKA